MASLQAVQAGLWTLISTTISGAGLSADVGLGWPPEKRLQDVGTGNAISAVSIYSRRSGRDMTRWLPTITSITLTSAAINSSLSVVLPPSTLTITGTPNVGDAVSLVVFRPVAANGLDEEILAGQVAVAVTGDTAATLATKLASNINNDSLLKTLLLATASGNTVGLVALSNASPMRLSTNIGNGGSQVREVGRRELEFQITIWAQTANIRDSIGTPIDQAIANAEVNFGYELSDGTWVRLVYRDGFDLEDATLQDVYRRDYFVCLEYPITVTDQLYDILVPGLTLGGLDNNLGNYAGL